jgi:hypothetical protein
MGRIIAVALLGLLLHPQEDLRIRELIGKLEDDSFEEREKAERDLVVLGAPALPALRESLLRAKDAKDGGELRLRLRSAIQTIELEQKAKAVYSEPRPITLHLKDAPLREALEALARESGLKFESQAIDTLARVTLDVDRAPLLKVLDDLCRAQEARHYEYREAGVIRFLKEPHVDYPSAYAGPFRVRVLTQRLERATDFKNRTCVLHLSLQADYEKYLKPSRNYEIQIDKAWDDSGRRLEARSGDGSDEIERMLGGRLQRRGLQIALARQGAPVESSHPFTLKKLAPDSRRVTLEGSFKFTFPLEHADIRFEKLAAGQTQEAADYSIKLLSPTARHPWQVHFARKSRPGILDDSLLEDLEERIDRGSLVGVDEEGNEHKGTLTLSSEMVAFGGAPGAPLREDLVGFSYQTDFPTLKGKPLKELRFRFMDKSYVKSTNWKLEGLELP